MTVTALGVGWRLTCDECGRPVIDNSGLDEPLVWLLLADEGWECTDHRDACPQCVLKAAVAAARSDALYGFRAWIRDRIAANDWLGRLSLEGVITELDRLAALDKGSPESGVLSPESERDGTGRAK